MRQVNAIIIVLACLMLLSCKSRLQPRLYQMNETKQFTLKEMESYYRPGYVLTDNAELSYIERGSGTVLVTRRVGPPGAQFQTLGKIFTVGEKIAYQIMIQLPEILREDSLDLAGQSLCRLEGRFDLEESLRLYRCTYGFLAVDTLWTSSFRSRLSGIYVNGGNDTLIFKGDLKADLRN